MIGPGDLNDPVRRDYLRRSAFDKLMRRIGTTKETTIVLYGDKNNWWATYAFWVLQLSGHTNAKIMDGGRLKWMKENRPVSREIPKYQSSNYQAPERDDIRFRAFRDQTLKHMEQKLPMVDVRSPEEYRGERLHYAGLSERGCAARRTYPGSGEYSLGASGQPGRWHIRGRRQLRKIYTEENKLRPEDDVMAYCRIGSGAVTRGLLCATCLALK